MYFLYNQASATQQEQAFLIAQPELQKRFPMVSLAGLRHAFALCEPDLSLSGKSLAIEYESMTRVMNYLAATYRTSLEELEPPIYGPVTHYISKRLISLQQTADWATTHHQGATTPEAAAFYLSILTQLAVEDATANQVEQAFIIPASDTQPPKVLVEAMAFSEPGGISPFSFDALLYEWGHLRKWLRQRQDPLRPWNSEAIHQAAQLPQSVVQLLLFEPLPTSAENLSHFTRERLRCFQRLLKPYGYHYSPTAASSQ